ncbi:MAG TPA: hypothetical protein VHC44_11485 [Verrucomicrobiae bacterium]|nr:hypothetical protein [Verrucomicrobiae bacterium]
MQLQLNLILALRPPKNLPDPKAEPYRVELAKSERAILGLVREAVECPTPAKLQRVETAIVMMHRDLQTLHFVESELCHEQSQTA